jgi:hypothetical protein
MNKNLAINEELDLNRVWKSVTNVWDVTKLVFQDILNTSATLIKIAFITDESKIKNEYDRLAQRKKIIYQKIFRKVNEIRDEFGPEFKTFLFLSNPGLYMMERTLVGGGPALNDLNQFFEEAGVKVSDLPPIFGGGTPEAEKQLASRMLNSLQGNISPYENMADFSRDAKRINDKLSEIIGIAGRVNESIEGIDDIQRMLFEARKDSSIDIVEMSIESQLNGMKKLFQTSKQEQLIDSSAINDYLQLKKEELDRFIKILNTPISFVKKISEAKDLKELRNVIDAFENQSLYKVEGIDDQKEKELIQIAKKLFENTKKKGKKAVEKIIQAANSDLSPEKITDNELNDLCKLVVARSSFEGLIESLKNPDEKMLESQKQLKESFKKEFSDNINKEELDFLRQQKDGKKIAEFIVEGINKIDSAGL